MRIVHFSDIHLGALTRDPRALFDKRILGLLNYIFRRRLNMRREYVEMAVERIPSLDPDLVVCTGDVTCIGSPEEFRCAGDILQPLIDNRDFQFAYVPGNHDAYTNTPACVASLRETFQYLNRGRVDRAGLPFSWHIGGVECLMVDEAAPTSLWSSRGRLTDVARKRLEEWSSVPVTPDCVRILIGHFPSRRADGTPLPARRSLQGAEAVHAALCDGVVDISLCGHIHHPFVNAYAGGSLEVCAGSLSSSAVLNVIDITPSQRHWEQSWVSLCGKNLPQLPS